MEKYVKVKFSEEELEGLQKSAFFHNKSVNQYIHDCATGAKLEISPVYAAFAVSEELSKIRSALNEIFRRETTADVRLFEDDVIQLDKRMSEIEVVVADYLKAVRKGMT